MAGVPKTNLLGYYISTHLSQTCLLFKEVYTSCWLPRIDIPKIKFFLELILF